jgi:hypothetical protein
MQFFKRILQPSADQVAPEKRRSGQRLAINPEFPLRTGLGFIGRDVVDARGNRDHWNWNGQLVDCSEQGVRLQFGTAVPAATGETCDLKLDLEGFVLVVPCHVSNLRRQSDGIYLGLKHSITDEETQGSYRQFLEIVALGASLRPHLRKHQPEGSDHLVEQYASERRSCLNVWRHPSSGLVAATEILLKDCLVRMVAGRSVEYYVGCEAIEERRATAAHALEIHRLFHWVVPNLSPTVPEDVRKFLLKHAG